jgi:hypothetical protein
MAKRKPVVSYNSDGTVDVTLKFNRLRPRRGENFRSVLYHEDILENKDLNVYVKIWRRMPRGKIREVMLRYAKDRMINNSPVII